VWRIQPSFKLSDRRKERSSAGQSITVHLTIDGRDIELDLEENELLKTDPPVFLTKDDGRITRVHLDSEGIQVKLGCN